MGPIIGPRLVKNCNYNCMCNTHTGFKDLCHAFRVTISLIYYLWNCLRSLHIIISLFFLIFSYSFYYAIPRFLVLWMKQEALIRWQINVVNAFFISTQIKSCQYF